MLLSTPNSFTHLKSHTFAFITTWNCSTPIMQTLTFLLYDAPHPSFISLIILHLTKFFLVHTVIFILSLYPSPSSTTSTPILSLVIFFLSLEFLVSLLNNACSCQVESLDLLPLYLCQPSTALLQWGLHIYTSNPFIHLLKTWWTISYIYVSDL